MTSKTSALNQFAEAAAFLEAFTPDPNDIEKSAYSAACTMAMKWGICGKASAVLLLAHFGHRAKAPLSIEQAVNVSREVKKETDMGLSLQDPMGTLARALHVTGFMLMNLEDGGMGMDMGYVKDLGALCQILGDYGTQSLDPCANW